MPLRDEFVAQWSGRVGEEAARLAVSSARAVGLGGLLVPVWSVVLVVGHAAAPALAVGCSLALADVGLLVKGVSEQRRLHRILSERFGTKVWFLNSPSLREGQFQGWCQRHGVDPETGRPLGR